MRKTHSQSNIGSLVILPLLSKNKKGIVLLHHVLCFHLIFFQLLSIAMLGFLGSGTKLNHVFPCLSIILNINGCFLSSLLALYLSVKGITDLGKFILLSFRVILTSDQSFSKTSQIQFFLSFTFSGFNLPFIQNKCILLATLHNIIGTYE